MKLQMMIYARREICTLDIIMELLMCIKFITPVVYILYLLEDVPSTKQERYVYSQPSIILSLLSLYAALIY